jgi:hypothetical protein
MLECRAFLAMLFVLDAMASLTRDGRRGAAGTAQAGATE